MPDDVAEPHAETLSLGAELIFPLQPVFEGVDVQDGPRAPYVLDGRRVWLVTGYDDARAVLAHSRVAKDVHRAARLHRDHTGVERPVVGGPIATHLLNLDPPDHTRMRRLVVGAFTEARLRALRPSIEATAHALLDGLAGRRRADLVADYGLPLSLSDTCEILGVPEGQVDRFQDWARSLLTMGLSTIGDAEAVAAGMVEYLWTLVEAKRAEPAEDLLTSVIRANETGDLSDDELVAMVYVLSVAGFATSTHLICNGVVSLLENPDQLGRLRAEPALLPGAVEEVLRHAGPVSMAGVRFTTAPVTVGGVEIPEGEFVLVSLRAANRDAHRYRDPHRFDIDRADATHLSFGHGVHRCVGAPLGQMEAEVAIGALLRRFPDVALAADPGQLGWVGEPMVHNLMSLPVRLAG